MPSYLSPVFESLAERCLKRSVAALRDAGVPFCVIGSLALWARGGPESAHDIDLGIRPQDVLAAGEALAAAGFEVEIPPEDWLIKGWDREGEGEPLLVDLIYQTSAFAIDDEVLARAGVTDFAPYAVDPSAPLALDFFLDDKGPHVREVVQLGATPTH